MEVCRLSGEKAARDAANDQGIKLMKLEWQKTEGRLNSMINHPTTVMFAGHLHLRKANDLFEIGLIKDGVDAFASDRFLGSDCFCLQ